ncbi:adenylate/guanylate cyclase domain-containing protein [Mycolicibacterium neoaurum]|uniref:Adenylate and guanylate cyclase catalytic domain-containing protein n=1 Tax=Mycolicibacterium neoaurum TaxID=1795 RepID=A0AAV2WLK6_MYCNE|nr:adenylate/guanylate cyclase domain-containing protein [Mycolicibacterium neoaurum]QVI30158.1 adenylate/guanylate cyclase domain-containing protein [Mycolicibacterium neoaurum]TLH48700.1 adenylate/guanylate cyclase domain-containing protein [Mycolicibacterium neoaurum]CDQ45109.1 adenylate and guanylate cyclase catalytic domain-containing protein [Mycolicibacterium neoaurum]SDD42175.1 Adenylate cyclase, class 3 [Mycolicibacterium neoaurum]
MVDFDALIAGGITDARERAPLIEYLDGLGFTAEQMIDAERRGRLFGLAGDALQLSGPPVHSVRTAAAALGMTVAEVEHAWAALGLTVAGPDEIVLSGPDVDGLALWAEMRRALGDEPATGLLRVIGSVLARLSEAVASTIRHASPAIQIEQSHDELVTARAYREASAFVPRLGALIDAVHRHHLQNTRRYLELVAHEDSATVVCGVGFADLSGFTALTQTLETLELAALLNEFSGAAADLIHAAGARLVKFIGDEVMWVAPSPTQLVAVAAGLVGHPRAAEAGLPIRAGLDFGTVLATGGDYFGSPVNRAARLVAAAEPGQILVSATLHELLPGVAVSAPAALTLKGFAEPVTAYTLIPD